MGDRVAWLRLRDDDGYLAPARTRVLLAVMRCHQRDGRATARSVAEECGLSVGSIWRQQLVPLRQAGLVTWVDGRSGTLRPLVKVVAHG